MDNVQLSIFHTNDMHGRAEAMARLRSFVRRRKAELEAEGQTVLFFDAGDALDRRFPECALSKGAALAPVLNAMRYDLMTMGNDILLTYGPQAMADLVQRLTFPTLAANCRDGDLPPAAGLQEAVSLDLPGGLRLGVLGLTAPWNGAYEAFGYHFPDSMETARRLVERLRAEGTSAIIVLSHLGLADDLRMAEEVPGIQAIIGAHSHDVLQNGLVHAGVLIAQAGAFAERVGLVRLTLDTVGGLRSATAEVVSVSEAEPQDPDVLAALAEATREVQALAARPVAILLAPLDVKYEAECDLGNVLADALRERMEAQAALVMGAHLNGALPSGTVTFGQVAEVSSSTANPQRTPVRGSQILSALEIGLDASWAGRRLGPFRGAPNGWPQISGMEVAFDSARPVGRRVVSVRIGGAPLQEDETYLVAHTDAETMSGVNLLRLEPGQSTESEVPTVMREVLEGYLRGHSPVPTPPRGRWTDVGGSLENAEKPSPASPPAPGGHRPGRLAPRSGRRLGGRQPAGANGRRTGAFPEGHRDGARSERPQCLRCTVPVSCREGERGVFPGAALWASPPWKHLCQSGAWRSPSGVLREGGGDTQGGGGSKVTFLFQHPARVASRVADPLPVSAGGWVRATQPIDSIHLRQPCSGFRWPRSHRPIYLKGERMLDAKRALFLVGPAFLLTVMGCGVPATVSPTVAVSTRPGPTATATPRVQPESPTAFVATALPLTLVPTTAPVANTPQPAVPPGFREGQEIDLSLIEMVGLMEGWGLSGPNVFRTQDGGQSWRGVAPPDPLVSAGASEAFGAFLDQDNAWVAFRHSNRIPSETVIWHTIDGGATWSASDTILHESIGEEQWAEFFALDASHAWVAFRGVYLGAGTHYTAQFFRTSNGGSTWDPLEADVGVDYTGFVFADPEYGWLTWQTTGAYAAGPPEYAVTRDGGLTWDVAPLPPPDDAPTLFDDYEYSEPFQPNLLSTRAARLLVSSFQYDFHPEAFTSYLYATENGGEDWETRELPPVVLASEATLIFFDAENGLLLGREIYRTEDAGQTWQHVKTVSWDGQFSFVDSLHGWAVARSGEAIALVKTSNGGSTWVELDPRAAR